METAKETRNTPSRDVDAELGQRAHMLIWSEGRKQGDVARQIGMSSGSLGLKLKGQRGWALAEVKAIASVLNTSVAYLFGESEDSTPGGAPEAPVSTVKTQHFAGELVDIFTGRTLGAEEVA